MKPRGDMRVVVSGSGSIGRRHIRNLRAAGFQHITACDPDASRLEPAMAELGVNASADFATALKEQAPDIVFVCTPPVLHVQQATLAVRAGANVFLEKPLSNSLQGIDDLRREVQQRGTVVQVGYNQRFNPGIRKLKELVASGELGQVLWARAEVGQYLPDWRPWQDYRLSYTARKELGGGIILDASHEIDYVLWLMGEAVEVVCMGGHVSRLEMDTEDSASLLVRFASGAHADIHLDCLQRVAARGCKLVGEKATAEWDDQTSRLRILRQALEPEVLDLACADNYTYEAELEYFLGAVDGRHRPMASLDDGIATLKVCMTALGAVQRPRAQGTA